MKTILDLLAMWGLLQLLLLWCACRAAEQRELQRRRHIESRQLPPDWIQLAYLLESQRLPPELNAANGPRAARPRPVPGQSMLPKLP